MPEGAHTASLYERDYYAWVLEQAAKLRDMARRGVETSLDLENLAEEVEDLAESERSAVPSQIRRILEHFLKLEHSPSREPGAGWRRSIVEARIDLADRLTPTLKRYARSEFKKLFTDARKIAALDLAEYGERQAAQSLPLESPYTLEQVLEEDWYPKQRH
jgi:hypothetical protein